MNRHRTAAFLVLTAVMTLCGGRGEDIVKVGAGSYATKLPEGAKAPPVTIYRTANVKGPMPTNDWWSSLAWKPFGDALYPHPLALKAEPGGLRVAYPGANITANKSGIFGAMPGKPDDFTIGHSAVAQFSEARADGYSDWFVDLLFADGDKRLRTSFGHGSPFVYVTIAGGDVTLDFGKTAPKVWAGLAEYDALGFSVGNRHYGVFAPTGSTWSDLTATKWACNAKGKGYFSVALLLDDKPEGLISFQQYAYNHVTATRIRRNGSGTEFEFITKIWEGVVADTRCALYPHQCRHGPSFLGRIGYYRSVRGPMELWPSVGWDSDVAFPGTLPSLPLTANIQKSKLGGYLADDVKDKGRTVGDTYALGKQLGKWATLLPIAEQLDDKTAAAELTRRIKATLENFFTATDASGALKTAKDGVFYYDKNWGTLIGYPASFGSDDQINDHHFHYGYFIRAAAEIARRDPAWAKDWGGMVNLLIRDIASGDRQDPLFPFLRNFDPYAGHSWASGHARFADGNNNESSSEAVNAWYGLILWAEATGDAALRDLGMWLYSTEIAAIEDYWFNVHGDLWPKEYPASVVTMVWGGKGANATWFGDNPESVHGINWLPFTPASLYLGRYPNYCAKNYAALVAENKADDEKKGRKGTDGRQWDQWADLIWMYRALSDPQDALAQFEAQPANFKPEAGNSLAFTYLWLSTLAEFGQIDRSVTADTPFYAVFSKDGKRTHVAWSGSDKPREVRFSDGVRVACAARGFAVH
ncbi:MAG TPA: glycosyl hydrolase [Chthoniobacteraceae bacterium]|nr:glycosyl hydrolase [Chthoniobacteraceae bacterium]